MIFVNLNKDVVASMAPATLQKQHSQDANSWTYNWLYDNKSAPAQCTCKTSPLCLQG